MATRPLATPCAYRRGSLRSGVTSTASPDTTTVFGGWRRRALVRIPLSQRTAV